MKYAIGIARFPGGWSNVGQEHPDTTDWLLKTAKTIGSDKRISRLEMWRVTDTPITMGRNRAMLWAKANELDYLVMIDSDMSPDCHLDGNPFNIGIEKTAKPFWDSSFDFVLQHKDPCIIAAPYCGPSPYENVYVFQWGNKQSNCPEGDFSLDQYSREQAGVMGGIQEAAALPTGLCIIDVRVSSIMKPPWFYYEWKSDYQEDKASTEDVTFTRDCSLQGIPCYCNWDAWAGHLKLKRVGKPRLMYVEMIGQKYREAVLENRHFGQRMMALGDGIREPQRPKTLPQGKVVKNVVGNPDGDGESGDIGYSSPQAVERNGVSPGHDERAQGNGPLVPVPGPSVKRQRKRTQRRLKASAGPVTGSGQAADQP